MSFLDKFKNNDKKSKQNEHIIAYQKMIELLDVDGDTTDQLNRCINDPRAYYEETAENYQERDVDSDADDDTIIWLGIVDILIEQGKMFEFDYSVELEDFIYGIQEINENDLVFDENHLDEDSDIVGWFQVLYNEWSSLGVVIAGMDIDSDSYCVLIITRDAFDALVIEAEKTGHKIALAQDL